MIFTAKVHLLEEIQYAVSIGAKEILISHQTLSREGGASSEECEKIIHAAAQQKLKITILADKLIEENDFGSTIEQLRPYLKPHLSIRVQDIGLASFLKSKNHKFQLSLSVGNANWESISTWEHYFKTHLEKLVLNNEIPKKNLFPILEKCDTPIEILGFGKIPIYYSPRKLLSFQNLPNTVQASSEESGSHSFYFKESYAGTNMFFSKDLCLIDHLEELDTHGLHSLCIDLRDIDTTQITLLKESIKQQTTEPLKSKWPKALLHGYFGNNRSDSVFKHLPKKRKSENETLAIEILDQNKSYYLVKAHQKINIGIQLKGLDRNKNEILWNLESLFNLSGETISELKNDEFGLIKKVKQFQQGSFLYFSSR